VDLWITGGAIITAQGHRRLGEGTALSFAPGLPAIPPASELFSSPPARYGRFDPYTRLACAVVALALRDAGLDTSSDKRPIGIVAATRTESLGADLAYYETARSDGGALSSPNLFSYTLPNVCLGECAAHFHLSGPTVCVGHDEADPVAALACAARFMAADGLEAMLAGVIESPLVEASQIPGISAVPAGAAFVALECRPRVPEDRRLTYERGRMAWPDGRALVSLLELFRA
jgi:3-oxoacyl-(acyl-carrier-protein) synthase